MLAKKLKLIKETGIIYEFSILGGAVALSIIDSTRLLGIGLILAVLALLRGKFNRRFTLEPFLIQSIWLRRLVFPLILVVLSYGAGFYRLMQYPDVPTNLWEKKTIGEFQKYRDSGRYDRLRYRPVGEGLTHSAYNSYFYSKYMMFMWNRFHSRMSDERILRMSNMLITALAPLLCYLIFSPIFGIFTAFVGSLILLFLPMFIYHLHCAFFPGTSFSLSLLIILLGTRILLRRGIAALFFLPLPALLALGAHFYGMLRIVTLPLVGILPVYAVWNLLSRRLIIFSLMCLTCVFLIYRVQDKHPVFIKNYFKGGGETLMHTITVSNPHEFRRYLRMGGYDPNMELRHWKTHMLAGYALIKGNVTSMSRILLNIQTLSVSRPIRHDFYLPFCLPTGIFGFFLIGLAVYIFQFKKGGWYWVWFWLTFTIVISAILLSWKTSQHRMLFTLPFLSILVAYGIEICVRKIIVVYRS